MEDLHRPTVRKVLNWTGFGALVLSVFEYLKVVSLYWINSLGARILVYPPVWIEVIVGVVGLFWAARRFFR